MENMERKRLLILESLMKLERWIERNQYKGYDPADGLTSVFRPLTFGNINLERILIQSVWKSPINLRPVLGVKPLRTNIGTGYMAWGYLCRFNSTHDKEDKKKAISCLDWLIENKAPNSNNYCWGKMFDFVSRGGRQNKFEPITVWTSLIGHAFLDAYEILGNENYLDVCNSICQWIVSIPRNYTRLGACINYTGSGKGDCTIHNQSMLAASILARTGKITSHSEYLDVAEQAILYTCSRQHGDGSWLYGEESKFHWIDSFHTGYNLYALKCYIDVTKDETFKNNLLKGLSFYKNYFFTEEGLPKYYHNKKYPIDIQCAAQAIETLATFQAFDNSVINLAIKVAEWTINTMQDRTGYFYYRQYPFITVKVPMIHWGQATTYRALALLYSVITE